MQPYVILVQQVINGKAKNMLFGASTLHEAMTLVKALEAMQVNADTFVAVQDAEKIVNVYESVITSKRA